MTWKQINWKRDIVLGAAMLVGMAVATHPAFMATVGLPAPSFNSLLMGTVVSTVTLFVADAMNVVGF